MNAIEIENALKAKADAYLMRERDIHPRWSNWAGDLGFECDTYQCLARLHPELKPLPDIGLMKIFRASSMTEKPNLQFLSDAGIKIVEQGRPYQWVEKKISGRIDSKIGIEVEGKEFIVPLEHKAVSPYVFRDIIKHKAEGIPLQKSKRAWLRKYPGQIMTYELMDGAEFGSFFYYDKAGGDYLFWIVSLDLEYAETLVQRAERVNKFVDEGVIPPAERKEICERCDFEKTACFTGKEGGEGYEMIFDQADLDAKLARWDEIREIAKEFEEIDDDIKSAFKGKTVITADFKIESKPYEYTKFNVPPEIGSQYAEKRQGFRTTIKRLVAR